MICPHPQVSESVGLGYSLRIYIFGVIYKNLFPRLTLDRDTLLGRSHIPFGDSGLNSWPGQHEMHQAHVLVPRVRLARGRGSWHDQSLQRVLAAPPPHLLAPVYSIVNKGESI